MILAAFAFAGLASAGIAYLAVAALMVRRLAARRFGDATAFPSITILKPLHGDEPELFANLSSFVAQDYPGHVQVIFGAQAPNDPAIAIAGRVEAAHPDRDVEIVVDGRIWGANRKVSNLVNMAERARGEIVVVADSDMQAPSGYLRRLVAALAEPGTGVVTCPYHGLSVGNLWSRLTALAIDSHFLPGMAMGVGLGVGHPCMGSTIALRRETLERIGGFRTVADELADDHVIGARVRGLGLRVTVMPFTVGHVCPERRPSDLLRQELRWVRTVRQVEPLGHFGSLITHPLAYAVAALALAPGAWTAGLVAAAIAARTGLCLCVERTFALERHRHWLVPVRDLLSFGLFVASFFGRAVSWRGLGYDVARSGALVPKVKREPT